MQTPNAVLTAATAAAYFPTLDPALIDSPVFQDMIDDAMATVNETLGIDLSMGPDVEVTQVFQPDATMGYILRMVVPMDLAEPVTVAEGENARVMSVTEFTQYSNMIMSGGVWQNYWWFDRGRSWGANFVMPMSVTYTPRDTVFRTIKQFMLDLLRVRFLKMGMDANSYGLGMVSSISDQDQTVAFATGATSAGTYEDQEQRVIQNFLYRFRGPRVG